MTPEELSVDLETSGQIRQRIEAWRDGYKKGHNAALEEAAKLAEADNNHCGQRIAAAIRELKK